ncbi:MAG: hypothetical protein GXO49_04415 [Chlorobi bacterium]|nr:hypothetical protein [Chlorobiota bacterium]
MNAKIISVLFILIGLFYQSKAQVDTTGVIFDADTSFVIKNPNLKRNNPTVATLLSILPGAGQAYNRQYWKIPIFYGLLGYQTYNYNLKNKKYKKYLNALVEREKLAEDPNYVMPTFPSDITNLTDDQLTQYKDKYRRSRDLSAVLFIAIYVFNIIDANVYANLSDFDVSEDLTLSIKPELMQTYTINNQNSIGISFKLRF